MNGDVQRHDDDLLAAHYSWMSPLPWPEKVADMTGRLAGCMPSSQGSLDQQCRAE
jgi:hypothetical protein